MADYTLYYWPLPFRGQFVRAVLAHVSASWNEADMEALSSLMRAEPTKQLVPHMGPPVLTDHAADFSLAQTPAILAYLGGKYGLIPNDPVRAALTAKIIADANDVLYAADSESNTRRNPGWKRGIYIGSAKTGWVTAFIPDPEPDPDNSGTSGAEGVAVDAQGTVYGAEVGPRMLRKYERRER